MKAEDINSLKDAQNFCEGLLNDFEGSISDKQESLNLLYNYTMALMNLFKKNENEIDKMFYKITCNECREMTIERFQQAVKELYED